MDTGNVVRVADWQALKTFLDVACPGWLLLGDKELDYYGRSFHQVHLVIGKREISIRAHNEPEPAAVSYALRVCAPGDLDEVVTRLAQAGYWHQPMADDGIYCKVAGVEWVLQPTT